MRKQVPTGLGAAKKPPVSLKQSLPVASDILQASQELSFCCKGIGCFMHRRAYANTEAAAPMGSITTSADTAIATATDVSAKTYVSVVASVPTSAPPVYVLTFDTSSADKKSEPQKPLTTNASNVLTTAIPESAGVL
ncbi:Uncharacterized protein Rs2_06005 [Raphanus sativus]|nr:Uncharacterized protein Rs2_06005 [Raphanus sativus]